MVSVDFLKVHMYRNYGLLGRLKEVRRFFKYSSNIFK